MATVAETLFRPARRAVGGPPATQERYGLAEWAQQLELLNYGGLQYLAGGGQFPRQEQVRVTAPTQAISGNGVVFGVLAKRMAVFTDVRFKWLRFGAGPRPTQADMFTDAVLAPLDRPLHLLSRMELDVAQAGNSFVARHPAGGFSLLPPQWCYLVVVSDYDVDHPGEAPDARPGGLVYAPPSSDPAVYLPGEFGHHAPYPDPDFRFLGMSYLRPVLNDVAADNQTRQYVRAFYENSATPNIVMKFPEQVTKEVVQAFREAWRERHEGAERAFRTAFIGGGADPVVVGNSLKDLDQVAITKTLHSAITVSSGVADIVLGTLSGHESSTYANYGQAMRNLLDTTIRHLWRSAVDAFAPLLPAPPNARLGYDSSGTAAAQQDARDDADILEVLARTARTLKDGGWDGPSIIEAITTGDLARLQDTGLVPVQLQPPGAGQPAPAEEGE